MLRVRFFSQGFGRASRVLFRRPPGSDVRPLDREFYQKQKGSGGIMLQKLTMSGVFEASPEKIYKMWLSSSGHSAMTGSPAKSAAKKNGKFTAWDGYISGENLELKPGKLIVQAWRTTEFPDGAADSRLEIRLEPSGKGTKLTLLHTEIPAGQAAEYKKGWKDYYFDPMKEYFKKK
jgi:activator of HSP90 ATPase